MAASYKIKMDSTQKILLKRALNKDGTIQKKFTQRCAKEMNPFIPFRSGQLKDRDIQIGASSITYTAQYAAKQYHTNAGMGVNGTSNGGIRGKYWDKRMWLIRGNEIVKDIAKNVGGRARW